MNDGIIQYVIFIQKIYNVVAVKKNIYVKK